MAQRSIRFPDDLVERARFAEKEEYRNFSQLTIIALREWLDNHYPETHEVPEPELPVSTLEPEPKPEPKPESEYVIPPRKKPGPPRPQPSVGIEEVPPVVEKPPERQATAPVDPYAPYDESYELPKIAPRRRF